METMVKQSFYPHLPSHTCPRHEPRPTLHAHHTCASLVHASKQFLLASVSLTWHRVSCLLGAVDAFLLGYVDLTVVGAR